MQKYLFWYFLGAVSSYVINGVVLTWELKKTRSWTEYAMVIASWPSVLKGRKW